MLIGQMSFKKTANSSDFLQLDICGCTAQDISHKLLPYTQNIPIILHGDWKKNGFSENNLRQRKEEYINLILEAQKYSPVLGITLHPPSKNKYDLEEVVNIINDIEYATHTPVFLENRSNHKLLVSAPEDVIEFSINYKMTIDIPQLFISCKYDQSLFFETLSKINWTNVREIHLANIKRDIPRTFVARKLNDGILEIEKILPFIKDCPYCTLEILGGTNVFDTMKQILSTLL